MKITQINDKCNDQGQKPQGLLFFGLQSQQQFHSQKESFNNEFVIQLHRLHGNKWKKISSYFYDKNDSFVKNYFYSLLRKSIRKLNSYIKSNPTISKIYKPLKMNFIFKLTNLAEMQRNELTKYQNYKSLLYDFLTLIDGISSKFSQKCQQRLNLEDKSVREKFVYKILQSVQEVEQFFIDFKLNKKGNSRRKCPKKLEIKRELIQKAQKQKSFDVESQIEFDGIEDLIDLNEDPTLIPWPMAKTSVELLNITSERNTKTGGLGMFESEESFDPVLFK